MIPRIPKIMRHHIPPATNSLAAAGLTIAMLFSPPALPARFTDAEINSLPPYCTSHGNLIPETRGASRNPVEQKRWMQVIDARMYETLHHWCWGLALTNRAKLFARTKQERYWALEQSIGEFDYVIGYVGGLPSPLMPEVLFRKGENLMELNRIAAGVGALHQAMALKPDYWPPYAAMSDHYKKTGDLEKAREWLGKALAIDPQHKALLRRQAELGGAKVKSSPPPSSAEASAGSKPAAPAPRLPPEEQAPSVVAPEPPPPLPQ